MPLVSSLFVYPIKSCRGIACAELKFGTRGILHDREWMIVDPKGRFITLRDNALMAQIQPQLDTAGELVLTAPGVDSLQVPSREAATARRPVRVWGFEGEAIDLGEQCSAWVTRVLGERCRLVRFADDVHRFVSQKYTSLQAQVSFADGYPVLLTSLESLAELNRRLEEPLPMYRFRPNIVVRNGQPFEEDTWAQLQVGELSLSLVKPCDRCVATTVDQDTLRRGPEPLRTLARFRRAKHGVLFGQNAVHHGPGIMTVGDELVVTATKPAPEMLAGPV
jgi:uncharacterized protein